jgi:hypothetical protein
MPAVDDTPHRYFTEQSAHQSDILSCIPSQQIIIYTINASYLILQLQPLLRTYRASCTHTHIHTCMHHRQHAKNHYHCAGHPFSLELVTGRIWSYVGDRFVHVDPLSEYLQAAPSSAEVLLLSSQPAAAGARGGGSSSGVLHTNTNTNTNKCWGHNGGHDVDAEEDVCMRMLLERLDLHTSDKLVSDLFGT